jgi:hypothetical protein
MLKTVYALALVVLVTLLLPILLPAQVFGVVWGLVRQAFAAGDTQAEHLIEWLALVRTASKEK